MFEGLALGLEEAVDDPEGLAEGVEDVESPVFGVGALDDPDGAVDAGAFDPEPPDDFAPPALRKVGGPESSSRLGLLSVTFFFLGLVPSGTHLPSPNQASCACRAPVTVNSPWGTPVRIAS